VVAFLIGGCGADDSAPVPGERGDSGAVSASSIRALGSRLIYLPDQTGGKFHDAFVRVRNTSRNVALDVGGQLSIKDSAGQLVKSVNPTEINLLPGQEGVLSEEGVDLPRALKNGTVDAQISVREFRKGPRTSPVSFSGFRLEHDDLGGCKITGTVANTFTRQKKNLQIRAIGLNGQKIVTGGFTYVDQVFPGQDATFEINVFSSAACPPGVQDLVVSANLGEDKIFNP
jgi:hypothetical protein